MYYNIIILIVASITGCFGLPSISLETGPIVDFDELIIDKKLIIKCGDTDYIRLSKKNLYEIPEDLVKSENIKSISLTKNEITEIDKDAFKDAPNLECIDMSQNRITLDRLSIRHDGLRTLILDNQRISEATDMSNWIDSLSNTSSSSNAMLPNVETLSLRGVSNVRDVLVLANALPKLENIYLSGSDLRTMSQSHILTTFPNLKRVYLDNGSMDFYNIDNYGAVEELYLDNNVFRYLFVNSNLTNLKVLSLANCSLTYPMKFSLTSLESLDLSNNVFSYLISDLFKNMTSLRNLNLGHNQLREVPYLIYLNRLKRLSLNYNYITKFVDMNMPSSLMVLGLKGNGLAVVNKTAFSNLHQLQALDLSENEIESLPEGWDESLEMLEHLNLRFNRLLNIQSMMIKFLPSLAQLYVKGNEFKSIDTLSLEQLPDKCTVYTF